MYLLNSVLSLTPPPPPPPPVVLIILQFLWIKLFSYMNVLFTVLVISRGEKVGIVGSGPQLQCRSATIHCCFYYNSGKYFRSMFRSYCRRKPCPNWSMWIQKQDSRYVVNVRVENSVLNS